MINFLSSQMQPSVKSDAILDDFYLPDNLISADVRKLNSGFMAYHVVKPPICLDFELICHTDVYCIKLWPKVNSLKTTGFEIFVKNSSSAEFVKVGSCFNLTEDGVIFFRMQSNGANSNIVLENNFKVKHFFHFSYYKVLRHVKTVRIRITQTAKCAPVLKRVEMWGEVSREESEIMRARVQEILRNNTEQLDVATENIIEDVSSSEGGPSSSSNASSAFSIPEEFLDTITYDVMSLPMVLPSGKTIDRLTLDKHNLQEEKWGRPPSDPYTGQCFTAERKPVLNTSLKAQIDKFLLENEHTAEFSKTARTVGTVRALEKRPLSNDCNFYSVIAATNSSSETKRQKIELDKSEFGDSIRATLTVSRPLDDSLQGLRRGNSSNSLDEAVKNALKTVTRFTKRANATTRVECFQCQNNDIDSHLYKIRHCSHLVCRHCLSSKKIQSCLCGTAFGNHDVEKYHKSLLR